MSKRQEMRAHRRRERIRNRIVVIVLVIAGALLVTFALVLPNLPKSRPAAAGIPLVTAPARTSQAAMEGNHLGSPDASVKLDVYEDFRCSFCRYYTQNVEPLVIQNYVETGKVYYTYRTFITIDSGDGTDASSQAANAALCAADQGRFWAYHDTLFANQKSEAAALFSDDRLTAMARDLQLDMARFTPCFQGRQHAAEIQGDVAQGRSLNVRGTPSFFVDGVEVQAAGYSQYYDAISKAVEAALAGK